MQELGTFLGPQNRTQGRCEAFLMRRREEPPSQKISQHCQTSLAHLCDHFCLQRGPQRPVRHTQDNDNKPAIKAFKIQLEPGLELTPSNTFPAVLTHLGWGWPLEPGKGFLSFQQPSVYFHCNTRAKDTAIFILLYSFSATKIRYLSALRVTVSC